jgi:hypothetical protein
MEFFIFRPPFHCLQLLTAEGRFVPRVGEWVPRSIRVSAVDMRGHVSANPDQE